MPDDEYKEVAELLWRMRLSGDWAFDDYPLEPLYDEEGKVEGCYRTPPAPTG